MVSTRFNIFGYAIIFMSLHFVAYSLQDIEKTVTPRNKIEEHTLLSRPEKETLDVVHVGYEVVVKDGVIGGRKMANEEHIKSKETASKKPSSSSSENLSNGDHKPHTRSKKIYHDHHHVKGKMSSTFMVINADYHVPRSHPPRNN